MEHSRLRNDMTLGRTKSTFRELANVRRARVRNFYLLCCLAVLGACSNGRGSVDSEQPPPSPPAQSGFTVSGTVAGLDGDGLVVQLNGGNDLAVPNNGTFTFTTQLADAAAYSVDGS